ncbi:MAG: hypothetical protein HZC05_02430 [Candidatus Magasanikbacteria bacterium]|nr:hypothetical protein [Candidatus Magasanikbacteria bacterium]
MPRKHILPKRETQKFLETSSEKGGDKTAAEKRERFVSARLSSETDIEAQKRWQKEDGAVERRAKTMFDKIAADLASGKQETSVYRELGLPETDSLISDLTRASQDAVFIPSDDWHREVVDKLRHYRAKDSETETDVLRFLVSPDTPASTRLEFFEKEIQGLLEYTAGIDMAKLREIAPTGSSKETEKKEDENIPPLELPPPSQDEMNTSMDEMQEKKEGGTGGYFSVHPFWGGYYREQIYENHKGGARWGQAARAYGRPTAIGALKEERVMRGLARGNAVTDLPMPYGFAPNPASFKSIGALLVQSAEGLWRVVTTGAAPIDFTVMIGKTDVHRHAVFSSEAEEKKMAVNDTCAGVEAKKMLQWLAGSTIEKARVIKRFVKGLLRYSQENALNAVYENDPDGYFAAIEKNKKADCDVANAYYLNLLSRVEIKARLAVGHYVKMKDANGSAVMGSGSRHAWSEVWDEAGRQWIVFDATPPGDPTIDEEPPDEKSEDDAGPGDYGEQEAQPIIEEEFLKFKEKIAEAKRKAAEETATPEERASREFAKSAGCTPEQARRVMAKIAEARNVRDARGRVVRDGLADEFQKIVETNFKDVPEYRGPVMRSQGDEMDDKVMIGKEVRLGVADPLGYAREILQQKITQEYGGMDVWLVFDRSGSMDEIDTTTNRPKKEEQQLAGFLTLDGINAFSYKTESAARQDLLISPLSVRSSVIAFQGNNADALKSLGASWTPKEQYDIWSGLESNIGGGTPAHLGIMKARAEIERAIALDKKNKGFLNEKKRLRVVMVFMDGVVDNETAYLAEQKKLEDLEVFVSSWGMTESARQVDAYSEGHCVPSARDMIEPVAKHIVAKAQLLKLKQ